MRFVPILELPELVSDPALAHRTPLGMPIKMTKETASRERSANFLLGVASLVLAGLCAMLTVQYWDEVSLVAMLGSRRHIPTANLFPFGLLLFGTSGVSLLLRAAKARAGGLVH
jgi:hypothetical protein